MAYRSNSVTKQSISSWMIQIIYYSINKLVLQFLLIVYKDFRMDPPPPPILNKGMMLLREPRLIIQILHLSNNRIVPWHSSCSPISLKVFFVFKFVVVLQMIYLLLYNNLFQFLPQLPFSIHYTLNNLKTNINFQCMSILAGSNWYMIGYIALIIRSQKLCRSIQYSLFHCRNMNMLHLSLPVDNLMI